MCEALNAISFMLVLGTAGNSAMRHDFNSGFVVTDGDVITRQIDPVFPG